MSNCGFGAVRVRARSLVSRRHLRCVRPATAAAAPWLTAAGIPAAAATALHYRSPLLLVPSSIHNVYAISRPTDPCNKDPATRRSPNAAPRNPSGAMRNSDFAQSRLDGECEIVRFKIYYTTCA